MDIREALAGTGTYRHTLKKDQPAQQHLWRIPRNPPGEFPVGLRIRVSGSGQSLPIIPWVALLDDDVTTTATDGLYLCYLYTQKLDAVYLSMNQGATQHLKMAKDSGLNGRAAEQAALAEISRETATLQSVLENVIPPTSQLSITLGASNYLPLGYEAGNIAAIRYSMANLPSAASLGADLARFATLYKDCISAKNELAANHVVKTSARSVGRRTNSRPILPEFKPKDSTEYLAHVSESTQKRTRNHEELIHKFGQLIMATGRQADTNVHPRDLVVYDSQREWLIEAKIVGSNAEHAVRAAIGQLYSYRHFYYRERRLQDPRLMALFDAPIGHGFEQLLISLDIDYIYRHSGIWAGTPAASALLN